MRDLYQTVTDSIVAELERGATPWLKPWREGVGVSTVSNMPRNAATNRSYSGVNVLLLWSTALERGYSSGRWLTYKQAAGAGGNVRKGEKGTQIIFVAKVPKRTRAADGSVTLEQIPIMRAYYVFNVAQCDGLPASVTQDIPLPPAPELDSMFQSFVAATQAKIQHGGDRAYYAPLPDYVAMPHLQAFKTLDSYKATLAHELCHWTGHGTRLARDFNNRFGTEAYAFEELIAEIGAAFLCAHFGVAGELRHAGYVANWLKVLKDDKRAIFTAASQASKAADLLRSFSEPQTAEESDVEPIAAEAA